MSEASALAAANALRMTASCLAQRERPNSASARRLKRLILVQSLKRACQGRPRKRGACMVSCLWTAPYPGRFGTL
jgi:hypothetical protein